MADELQPPEPQITTTTTTAPPPPPPPPLLLEQPHHTAAPPQQQPPPKRQRRPSVRLGEIGDQPYDLQVRRTKPPIRNPRDWSKSVKARSITNLVNGNENVDFHEVNAQNGDVNLEFGNRKKARRGTTKRIRSSWIPKVFNGGGGAAVDGGDSVGDGGDGFRNFDSDSESPMKENSPVNSADNVNYDTWQGNLRSGTGRMENDEVENWERRNEGVRTWLIELGLSRYAPVFEVHEVDDQVLPFLTLEDLKDMGINAVGSRRKIYSAIQKLRRGFS